MQKPTQVVGRRVVAYIIDWLILAAIVAISWYALTKNVSPGKCIGGGIEINGKCRGFTADQSGNRAIWIAIVAIVAIAIFFVMQGLTGKTPGKAVVGIKVIRGDGRPPGIGRAIVREILWIIDGLPGVNLVGFITALVTQNNQRVGDMVAGTYVVDRNFSGALAAAQPGGAPISAPPPSGAPVSAAAPDPGGQAADWYPDPQGQARLRYWDGQRWTEHTSA
ncbi:MAG: hypothetical protein QOI19_2946 [Thermoleophilaceae bacterium]|jgi:uncharacterized RDD family membrane protein YckC|nr:hypothetical protein [Thermoleophilaceae bacterium]